METHVPTTFYQRIPYVVMQSDVTTMHHAGLQPQVMASNQFASAMPNAAAVGAPATHVAQPQPQHVAAAFATADVPHQAPGPQQALGLAGVGHEPGAPGSSGAEVLWG